MTTTLAARKKRLAAELPVTEVLRRLGVRVERSDQPTRLPCVFDKHKSTTAAAVYPEANVVRCFACNITADVVRVVQLVSKPPLAELAAVEWLESEFGVSAPTANTHRATVSRSLLRWEPRNRPAIAQHQADKVVVAELERLYLEFPNTRRYCCRLEDLIWTTHSTIPDITDWLLWALKYVRTAVRASATTHSRMDALLATLETEIGDGDKPPTTNCPVRS